MMRIVRGQICPMSAARRWAVYGVGAGLWLSGVLWLGFHYFLMRESDFGPTPHPLEHWWLILHGGFGFAALWTLGLLWGVHIAKCWGTGQRRVSGIAMLVVLAVLIVSGYLLYYAGGDNTRATISLVHWIIGLALPLPFVLHRFARAR